MEANPASDTSSPSAWGIYNVNFQSRLLLSTIFTVLQTCVMIDIFYKIWLRIYYIWLRKSPVILKKFGLHYVPVELNTLLTDSGVETDVWSSEELDELLWRCYCTTDRQKIEQRKLRQICTWTSKRTFYQNRSIEGEEYCRVESISRPCLAVKPNQDSRYCYLRRKFKLIGAIL